MIKNREKLEQKITLHVKVPLTSKKKKKKKKKQKKKKNKNEKKLYILGVMKTSCEMQESTSKNPDSHLVNNIFLRNLLNKELK